MTIFLHSSGPWQVEPTVHSNRLNFFCLHPGKEHHIGTLISGSRRDLQIFRANARLIKFAPDLLQSLEAMIMEFTMQDNAGFRHAREGAQSLIEKLHGSRSA